MGRTPKTFSDEQVVEMGKELVEWISSDEGKSGLQWIKWYYFKYGMFREDWHALIKRNLFRPYYEVARQIMSENISLNNKIASSYGNRYIHRYDDELGADEEAARDREAIRGKEMQKNVNLDQLNVLADCLARFSKKDTISIHITDEENHSE